MKRREASRALALGMGAAMLRGAAVSVPGIGTALAQQRRTLELQLLGFGLGIHVPAMAAFIAAGAWLVWTLTYDALGRQAASLAVAALLGGTFAISREITRRA